MKRCRFSEEQIIGILKQAEAGISVAELCRQNRISDATFYQWRYKYGSMDISEAKRLRQLEVENARKKKLVADHMLHKTMLKDVASKNFFCPTQSANPKTLFRKNTVVHRGVHARY